MGSDGLVKGCSKVRGRARKRKQGQAVSGIINPKGCPPPGPEPGFYRLKASEVNLASLRASNPLRRTRARHQPESSKRLGQLHMRKIELYLNKYSESFKYKTNSRLVRQP